MKNTAELLKTWDNKTLRDTKRNYQNALTHYNYEERKKGYAKTMIHRLKLITDEINNRYEREKIANLTKMAKDYRADGDHTSARIIESNIK